MFKMVNRYGNAHKKVKTERERDELLKIGYTVEEDKKAVKAKNKEDKE